MKKRIAVLALAACMLLSVLGGCSSAGKTIAKIGNYKISSGEYHFYLLQTKYQFANAFGQPALQEAFWSKTDENGVTHEQAGNTLAKDMLEQEIFKRILFDKAGLKLTAEERASVKDQLAGYEKQYGSAQAFEKDLETMGLTRSQYAEMLSTQIKFNRLIEYYFGPNGVEKLDEDVIRKNYEENYTRVKHILIKTQDLEGEKLENATNKANELFEKAKAANDEEFAKLVEENSEDGGSRTYPEGYIYCATDSFVEPFRTEGLKMKIGETKMVKTDFGYHIMRRYEHNTEEMFAEKKSNIMGSMAYKSIMEKIMAVRDEVEITYNEEEMAKISIRNIVLPG